MKFVFDKKLGQMVPENFRDMMSPPVLTDLEKSVNSWLDTHLSSVIDNSYSTRALADEFIFDNPNSRSANKDQIRTSIAKWFNANSDKVLAHERELKNAEEGMRSLSNSPAAKEYRKNRLLSPMRTINLAKVGADGIATSAEEGITSQSGAHNCYEQALNNFYTHMSQQPLLVHGIVVHKKKGIKYNHAWIEIGDMVYDTTMSISAQGLPKIVYYSLGNIDDRYSGTKGLVFRYDSQQVSDKLLKYHTYGPWEAILWESEDKE